MAELEFNVKANFDEIAKARQELERFRNELSKVTKSTDPIVVQDLTDKYNEQSRKVKELTSAMSRYATVTSDDFSKKMQSLTREVYSFELQADASKRKIEKLSTEIGKMQAKLRQGNLDSGSASILTRDIGESSTVLADEQKRYENLTGLGKQAKLELQNMQAEYAKYSGSSNAASDSVRMMTDALANMVSEMKQVPTVGEGASSLLSRLRGDALGLATSLVGGLGFEQLAQHIFNVRSEFQQLEISFTTMLGSEQKSGALMSQLIDTAAKTPFDMSSITNGAKQLLAYGTAANEVNDILVHLGDISAGLNVPLGDLVYLYGTTMAQGRMYTMDLRQFMGRGIPMAEELGKLMGKTTQEVQEAVSKGQVGADLVKKAIEGMTAEGGKFGGLMEKQSATLQGKWSNIGDSVDQMFNELGKKSEGIFGTGLDLISSLVDNWETVVKVIGTAAVAVGTYKAGLMAAASIQKVQNQATLDSISGNLDSKIQSYREQAELYHSYNGKDTSDYKASRMADLTTTVSNTDMIGNEKAEQLVSLKIKEAQTDGIITEQMAEQLQLKRDMLVAQQQSAAKEQMEADALTKGLDAKMSQYKEMENDYRHLNGKDTKDYKASRYNELGDALSDTENIGDEETEQRVSKQIELAKSEGLISEEMAKQLQLKRDLLVEQTKLAEKEQLQYENTINAKQAAEEELRVKQQQEQELAQAKAESELREKIAKANETAYGKALLETNALQKKVDLQQESYDKAMDEAREKRVVLAQLDEEIQKQKQLIEQKEADIVNDGGSVDTTNYGGYEDAFSDNENTAIADYDAEQAKLEELMQKRQQANEEFESANEKRKAIQQELQESTEKLTEAQEKDLEVYMEAGGEADEIGKLVQQGIDIEEGKITVTEAATAATQANTTSETASSTAKQANTAATGTNTTANAANTTSEAANTGATNTNTTSENVNTGAKERNSLVTSILSVGTKGLSLAQNVLTYATNAVTTSLKGMWAAMLANPLTSIITLVTTAISVFSMFGSEEEDASAKTQDMGNKAAEASNKVRSLFAILSSGKAEDHKDTINELKSAYEEYGIKLDDTIMKSGTEAEKTQELIKHKQDLIGVIEEQTIAMEHQNAVQQAYDDYNSEKDSAKSDFKDATKDILNDSQAGYVSTLVNDEDLKKLTELSQKYKDVSANSQEAFVLNQQYAAEMDKVTSKIMSYYKGLGLSHEQIVAITGATNDYIGTITHAKERLDGKIETDNKARQAAENASGAVRGLSKQTEQNALKNQFAKKTFKQLGEEMDAIRKICKNQYHLQIKVNYDDSQLPAWVKNMSQKQRKRSLDSRLAWLKTHKPGDSTSFFGGIKKQYDTIASEAQIFQIAGANEESKPKKSQKEIDKEKKAREKAAKAAEKTRNQQETQAGNRKKAEEDYTKAVSSYSEKAEETMSKNRINAMREGYEKELAQIQENAENEKKAVEDGIDKLVEARKKRDQAIWVNSGKNRKANMWTQSKSDEEYRNDVLGETMKDDKGNIVKDNGQDMTIGMYVSNQMKTISEKATKQNESILAKETQSMYDYLKEYGTFQEQKMAIAEEYAKKIADVESSTDSEQNKQWKIKSLQEQQKKDEDSVETSAIMQKIDWYQVFGNVGGIMKESLSSLLSDLNTFVGTEKFQTLGSDQQKTIVDAIGNIRNSIGNTEDVSWKDLAKDLVAYQEALKNAKVAQEEYTKTETLLLPTIENLQKQIGNAKKTGDVTKQTKLQNELNNVQMQLAESGKKIVSANNNVRSSGQKLAQTTQNVSQPISDIYQFLSTSGLSELANLWSAFDELKGGIDSLKALNEASDAVKGLKNAGDDMADAVKGAGEEVGDAAKDAGDALGEGLSKAGLIGQMVSAVLKILDILKDGIGTLISNLIDTILNAVAGILDNILSGDFVVQIVSSLKNGIGNILNAVTWGGFNSWFGVHGNSKEVNEAIDDLTSRNGILTDAIDKLKEAVEENTGMRAVENADKATSLQKEKESNLKKQMELQMGYHSAHGSFNHYFTGFTQEQIDAVSKDIGRQWSGSLSDLQSADEAAVILKYADMVQQIQDTGKGDYGERVLEKLQAYAAEAGELDDIVDSLNESLTQTSFDSLKDDFISTLMDMDASASDFSSNFSKMLMQAVLKAKIDDLMGDELQSFYDEWTARAKANGGELSTSDITALKEMYNSLAEKGLEIRDQVADITGYKSSYSQTATSGTFETMSQDTGEELSGRFTAVQIATEGTRIAAESINAKLDQVIGLDNTESDSFLTANISLLTSNVGNIWLAVDEGRTILAQSLMCLQSIDERQDGWNKPILQLCTDVSRMREKVDRL